MNLSFNQRSGEEILAYLLSFVIATSIHELMHAIVALRLGDDTARDQGRITLNPVSHFDPLGFFGMVMISIGMPFIGWGKPVPVNPSRFRGEFGRHRGRGMALVAAAGPLSNIVQALVMAIPYQYIVRNDIQVNSTLWLFIQVYIIVNVLLASFNMIPIPPLDGSKILQGILPGFWRPILQPLEQYGFLILMLLFFIGGRLGDSLVGGIMQPVRDAIMHAVTYGL